MNNNNTAVDIEKAGKMFELNEMYKNFPEKISEYKFDGKKYIVHSRFVGEKNIDEVINRLAFERAVRNTCVICRQSIDYTDILRYNQSVGMVLLLFERSYYGKADHLQCRNLRSSLAGGYACRRIPVNRKSETYPHQIC